MDVKVCDGVKMDAIVCTEGFIMDYESAVKTILPGRYRHYKGNEYEVLYIAKHSETTEPMVVYRALYGNGGVWVRPAEMWNETIERDGKIFPRFERIRP